MPISCIVVYDGRMDLSERCAGTTLDFRQPSLGGQRRQGAYGRSGSPPIIGDERRTAMASVQSPRFARTRASRVATSVHGMTPATASATTQGLMRALRAGASAWTSPAERIQERRMLSAASSPEFNVQCCVYSYPNSDHRFGRLANDHHWRLGGAYVVVVAGLRK